MIIQEPKFACDLTVLSATEMKQFAPLTDSLFAAVQESRELENGFAFRFINRRGQLEQIAQFIERESQCCPFLKLTLEVEPSSGPIWLQITGEDGTKEFLQAGLTQIQSLERS